MENTTYPQPDKIIVDHSLFLASSIQVEASQTIRYIHVLIAAILQYGMTGMHVTHNLIHTIEAASADESENK